MTETIDRDELVGQLPWSDGAVYRGIDVGDGWLPLIRDLHEQLTIIAPGYEVMQIKAKFGGLRYYVMTPAGHDGIAAAVRRAIAVAEHKADVTCVICGAEATERIGMQPVCKDHA